MIIMKMKSAALMGKISQVRPRTPTGKNLHPSYETLIGYANISKKKMKLTA
jgi:hypothetical protein